LLPCFVVRGLGFSSWGLMHLFFRIYVEKGSGGGFRHGISQPMARREGIIEGRGGGRQSLQHGQRAGVGGGGGAAAEVAGNRLFLWLSIEVVRMKDALAQNDGSVLLPAAAAAAGAAAAAAAASSSSRQPHRRRGRRGRQREGSCR